MYEDVLDFEPYEIEEAFDFLSELQRLDHANIFCAPELLCGRFLVEPYEARALVAAYVQRVAA